MPLIQLYSMGWSSALCSQRDIVVVVKLNRGSEPGLNFQKRQADSGFECSECFDKDKGLRGVAILMYRAIIMAAASCRVFVASSVLYSIAEDRERPRGPIIGLITQSCFSSGGCIQILYSNVSVDRIQWLPGDTHRIPCINSKCSVLKSRVPVTTGSFWHLVGECSTE